MSAATEATERARRIALYALLLIAAVAYFRIAAFSTLEMIDEGIVVYPSWRVAQGAIPYRDFQHIYGPATFAFNGALFALFGEDLAVVRWSLIAIKALIGLLVFALARRVASRGAALGVWALFVGVWGSPIWVFNNPYANHYGLLLALAALAVLLARPQPAARTLVALGLCVGLAALFKQTLGAFYAIALLWALLIRPVDESRRADTRTVLAIRVVSLLAMLASLGLYLSYALPHLDSPSTPLLLAPAALAAIVLGTRKPRFAADGLAPGRHLADAIAFGCGAALPPLACIAFYYWKDALGILAYDTVGELPHQFDWFVPLSFPSSRTLVWSAVVALIVVATRPAAQSAARWLAAGAITLTAGALWLLPGNTFGWIGEILSVASWTPLACVYAFAATALMAGTEPSCEDGRRQLRILWLFAAASLLQLYPAADLPHVAMILPASLPLLANAVERFVRPAAAPARLHTPALLATGVFAAIVAAPFVQFQRGTLELRPAETRGFRRASGIWNAGEGFRDAVDLVDFLATRSEPVFIAANQPMLYFLAARRSLFDTDDHVLYMVSTGIISPENARRMVSEANLLARIVRSRPLIIDDTSTQAGERLRTAFPSVRDYLARSYRVERRFGSYAVLQAASDPPAAASDGAD